VGGALGGVDGDTAEGILFQLMAGFCAHGLPFSIRTVGWLISMTNQQFSRGKSGRQNSTGEGEGRASALRLAALSPS